MSSIPTSWKSSTPWGDKMDSIGKRVTDLEMKPARRWDKIFVVVVGSIATAIVGFFLGRIGLPL